MEPYNYVSVYQANLAYLSLLQSGQLSACAIESICSFLNGGGPAEIEGNAEGCGSVGEVLSACTALPAGEADPEAESEVLLYPNPSGGLVKITGIDARRARLLDSLGSLLFSRELGADGLVDLSGLPAGLYFLQLSTEGRVLARRVVKE